MATITKLLSPKVDTRKEFIDYMLILFRRNPEIIIKTSEVKEQAMSIVDNVKKNHHNERSNETQINDALRGCALEYALDKCVPNSYKNPNQFDPAKPDTYVWDNKVDYLDSVMAIDCTLLDNRGYFSAKIHPAGRSRSDGYHWGKFKTKEKHKNRLDFLVGGHAKIDGDSIICNLTALVDVEDAFDYSNWSKSAAFNHEHAMYLSETVTHKI